MPVELKDGAALRRAMMSGINQLADAVQITLGPRGRNVAIEKTFGPPLVTKDGVSVAKEVELKDPYENMGALLVRDVASKTSDDAGDGTTTATVLARFLCREGLKLVEAGMAPISLKRGMDKCCAFVVDQIIGGALEIQTQQQIAHVATISANGDTEMGQILADAVAKVGRDGIITVEESQKGHTEVEATDGMRLDRGWANPEFCMDEANSRTVLTDPYILVTDMPYTGVRDMVPLFEQMVKDKSQLLIIAPEFPGNAIPTFVQNLRNRMLVAVCVKAPGFSTQQDAMLGDIAALTGATLITRAQGMDFTGLTFENMGRARKVVITRDSTVITDAGGAQEDIDARINQIKGEIQRTASEYDKEKMQDRLAKLQGGMCIIKVGAQTEVEMKEKKARLEDALSATRASLVEGVVPGGGSMLIWAAQGVQEVAKMVRAGDTEIQYTIGDLPVDETEQAGWNLVLKACEEPLRAIVANAGSSSDMWVLRIQDADQPMGCDAKSLTMVNLLDEGIIDPAMVTRCAMINAVSVASTFLTSEVAIRQVVKATADFSGLNQPRFLSFR